MNQEIQGGGACVPCVRGRVLLVEDDAAVAKVYGRILRQAGLTVHVASEGATALRILETEQLDLVVSDIAIPGPDGIALLRAAREQDPDLPVMLMTGGPDLQSAIHAVEYGASRYFLKPVEPHVLVATAKDVVLRGRDARTKRRAFESYLAANRQAEERDALEITFDHALCGLFMAYQPIVKWSSREVFAYEALVRTEAKELRRPDELIAVAEKLGRLFELGRLIRNHVAAGMTNQPWTVFMNLHPRDLLDEELYDPGAPLSRVASRVVLELTERASLGSVLDLQDRLLRLRELGFRLALDDLGAGYAGLTSFAQTRPDIVKLDMSLTRGVDADPTRQRLIRAMCGLCEEFGMDVVSEGVETAAERDTLARLGCDRMQGYFFAKPAPDFPVAKYDAPLDGG